MASLPAACQRRGAWALLVAALLATLLLLAPLDRPARRLEAPKSISVGRPGVDIVAVPFGDDGDVVPHTGSSLDSTNAASSMPSDTVAPTQEGDAIVITKPSEGGDGVPTSATMTPATSEERPRGGPFNKAIPPALDGLRDLVFSDDTVDTFAFACSQLPAGASSNGSGGCRDGGPRTPYGQHLGDDLDHYMFMRDGHVGEREGIPSAELPAIAPPSQQHVPFPLQRRRARALQHVVAFVITDGKFRGRIDALLGVPRSESDDPLCGGGLAFAEGGESSLAPLPPWPLLTDGAATSGEKGVPPDGAHRRRGWLQGTFHTFLMFDAEQQLSWDVHARCYGNWSIRDAGGGPAQSQTEGGGGGRGRSPKRPRPIGISGVDADEGAPDADDTAVSAPSLGSGAGSEWLGGQTVQAQSSHGGQGEAFTFSEALLARPHTAEYISASAEHRQPPNAAWKPWSVVLFLARRGTQRFLVEKARFLLLQRHKEGQVGHEGSSTHFPSSASSPSPLWYAILDDDTYALRYSLAYTLEPHTRELLGQWLAEGAQRRRASQQPEPSGQTPPNPLYFYGGHVITYCPLCNPKKHFPFAFGGSGIFMSRDAALALADPAVVEECRNLFFRIAGDEQLGGCIARSGRIAALHSANVRAGAENRARWPRRTHYGFAATDLFRGAAYDLPATAIGSYFLQQPPPFPIVTGTPSDWSRLMAIRTTSFDQSFPAAAAIPPFPVSFHHIKNATEVSVLAGAEAAWESLVGWREGNPHNRAAPINDCWAAPYAAVTPWPFVAAVLLADEGLINASLSLLAAPGTGERQTKGSADVPDSLRMYLQRLLAFSRQALGHNRDAVLLPHHVIPALVEARLKGEAAERRAIRRRSRRR